MPGLMVEAGDVSGAIAAFITENGFYATVQTEYDEQPIYIRSLKCRIFLEDQKLVIKSVGTSGLMESLITKIDLSHPDSLNKLLSELDGYRIWVQNWF